MKIRVGIPVAVLLVSLGLGLALAPQMVFAVRPPLAARLAASESVSGRPRRQGSAKIHQATGEVLSTSADSLLLLHARGRTKQRMAFTLTVETKETVRPTKGDRVIVYYRETGGRRVATRIRSASRSGRMRRSARAKSKS
ncbi:MAG TPA: hypothetical protein VNJ52_06875 [Patescibacteria group bacterium]|nr:hypothetical protein [Patescibacteria group bacterium]